MLEQQPTSRKEEREAECIKRKCAREISRCSEDDRCSVGIYVYDKRKNSRDDEAMGLIARCVDGRWGYDDCLARCVDSPYEVDCMGKCLGFESAFDPLFECVHRMCEENDLELPQDLGE